MEKVSDPEGLNASVQTFRVARMEWSARNDKCRNQNDEVVRVLRVFRGFSLHFKKSYYPLAYGEITPMPFTQTSLIAFGFGSLSMLGWLAAAAAPILIHLWSRRKYREAP